MTLRVIHRPVIAFDDCYYIARKPRSLAARWVLRAAGWSALTAIRAARLAALGGKRLLAMYEHQRKSDQQRQPG